jgi:predicted esterase
MKAGLWVTVLTLLLAGCAGAPDPASRLATAQALAAGRALSALQLQTRSFTLAAWAGAAGSAQDGLLSVYIEGDGLAWLSSQTPSNDPTPVDPLALRLAVAQPGGAVAYLARPCQYKGAADARCSQRYWTGERFAEAVIDASDQALDQLKARAGARRLLLVGYSGGGAVAALLAQRRNDVAGLATVAGNLDPNGWTRLHRVSPLLGSLDPMTARHALSRLPQWHWVGSADRNMPATLAQGFSLALPQAQVVVLDGFDHRCCWAERWPVLIGPVVRQIEQTRTAAPH